MPNAAADTIGVDMGNNTNRNTETRLDLTTGFTRRLMLRSRKRLSMDESKVCFCTFYRKRVMLEADESASSDSMCAAYFDVAQHSCDMLEPLTSFNAAN